ncbi:predicted protein [Aspergillus terreus NIH2624]|uniref:Transcription factor domain-containing protein n=1 Tax=Aspergillus terreus (strain NIH 2624 / FGSC A1156) TaxID=341663 RepID=Q0CRT2_ASPTN|nr:uncharacterized protein ATEG_03602 [Aspergillus terreus NIH2624]EAU35404.1 predicted protein [Aspergillus terreus NIH2624]
MTSHVRLVQRLQTSSIPTLPSILCLLTSSILLLSDTSEGDTERHNHLYSCTKGVFSLIVAAGEQSLEFVQAGILVSLYGHLRGFSNSAYLTIGSTLRVAHLLGLGRIQRDDTVKLERVFIWLGAEVVDRYIKADFASSGDVEVEYLDTADLLQAHLEWRSQTSRKDLGIDGQDTLTNNLYNAFYHEAEAASRLHQVSSFVKHNHGKELVCYERAVELDRDITALFLGIKSQEKVNLETKCAGGLTTCLSLGACQSPFVDISIANLQQMIEYAASLSKAVCEAGSQDALNATSRPPSFIIMLFNAELARKFLVQSGHINQSNFSQDVFLQPLKKLNYRSGLASKHFQGIRP